MLLWDVTNLNFLSSFLLDSCLAQLGRAVWLVAMAFVPVIRRAVSRRGFGVRMAGAAPSVLVVSDIPGMSQEISAEWERRKGPTAARENIVSFFFVCFFELGGESQPFRVVHSLHSTPLPSPSLRCAPLTSAPHSHTHTHTHAIGPPTPQTLGWCPFGSR